MYLVFNCTLLTASSAHNTEMNLMPRIYVGPLQGCARLMQVICQYFGNPNNEHAHLCFTVIVVIFFTSFVWMNLTTGVGGQYGPYFWSMSPNYIDNGFTENFPGNDMTHQFFLLPTMSLVVYKMYIFVFIEANMRAWRLHRV